MDFSSSMQIFPSWIEFVIQKIFDIIFKHPGPVVTVTLLCCISHIIFKKIIDPQLYECYKSVLRYEDTLQLLKEELEKDYQDYHWNDPEFCKAYLALYASYRELRMMAKRDYRGHVDPNDKRWNNFDFIKMSNQ